MDQMQVLVDGSSVDASFLFLFSSWKLLAFLHVLQGALIRAALQGL